MPLKDSSYLIKVFDGARSKASVLSKTGEEIFEIWTKNSLRLKRYEWRLTP
jgi:hypothetical protein